MRVIVAGPRDNPWPNRVWDELDDLLLRHALSSEYLTLVHGANPDARSVDQQVERWARVDRHPATTEPYPAEDFGKWPECGPLRNRHMAELGADLCVAFGALCNRQRCGRPKPHMTHGTASMVNEALRNDIEIRIVPL